MIQRLAVVAGLVLLLGAGLFTFLPTNANGSTCGTWVAPEWDKDESAELAGRAADLGDEGEALAREVATNYRQCTDALSTRRLLSIGLLVGAVLLPAGIVFVGRGQTATA